MSTSVGGENPRDGSASVDEPLSERPSAVLEGDDGPGLEAGRR